MSEGKTKKCYKCKEEVLLSAKKCKHCQADLRNWFVRHPVWSIVFGFFFLVVVASSFGGETDNLVDANEESEVLIENATTVEEKINIILKDVLAEKTNMGVDKLMKVEVDESQDGSSVTVNFFANDNLTTNLQKVGIESDMSQVYISLYNLSELDIKSVTVSAYFNLIDKYGNTNPGVIYKSSLDKAEADKVNWGVDDSVLRVQVLPSVWVTEFVHNDFK